MKPLQTPLSRRGLLGLSLAGASLAALGLPARAAKVATKARIVVIGAGAAGTALVNRLVERLEGAQITIIDARAEHLYQPGLSLVAAGLKPPPTPFRRQLIGCPRGSRWLPNMPLPSTPSQRPCPPPAAKACLTIS